jgi:hypothetical protein
MHQHTVQALLYSTIIAAGPEWVSPFGNRRRNILNTGIVTVNIKII